MLAGIEPPHVLVGGDAQPGHALQVHHAVHATDKSEPVTRAEHLVGGDRRQHAVATAYPAQKDALQVSQAGLRDGPIADRAAALDLHLDRELAKLRAELLLDAATRREERGHETHHGQYAENGEWQPDGRQFEHADRCVARLLHQPRDHEIGGGADQGHRSAQQHRKRQRHEKFRDALPAPLGRGGHWGDQHRDNRRVVQEGGNERDGRKQSGEITALCAIWAHGALEERPQGAGSFHGAGNDEERRHGDRCRIGKAGQCLGRRGHARDEQCDHGHGDHERGRRPFADERDDGEQDRRGRDQQWERHYLERHYLWSGAENVAHSAAQAASSSGGSSGGCDWRTDVS